MATTYVLVRDLPQTIQDALRGVGYRKRDIGVTPRDAFTMQSSYGDGHRAFCLTLNIATGAREMRYGSWGGANPFTQQRVDTDRSEHTIPPNGAAIIGQEGGGRPVSASLYVRPDQVSKYLPAPVECTDRERKILSIIDGYKSSARPRELGSLQVQDSEIESLITRGLLKRASNGATSITTEGKTARRGMMY